MSDTTNTAPSGADAAAPAPKSDAEASLQTQVTPEAKPEPTDEQKAAEKAEQQRQENEERKKRTTRDFIDRIKEENKTYRQGWNDPEALRRRLAEFERTSQPQTQQPQGRQQGDRRPTLEDHGYDFNAWQQADTDWVERQAERRAAQLYDQRAQQAREQETWQTYESKVAEFANDHEDFYEVVGSIPPLPLELQAAIAAHPQGPAIAYHLGNTPSDLLAYANTSPQFAGLALQQLAARLSAAPSPSVQSPVVAPPAAPAPTKPISQAPPPPPTVGGRSPTETPPEKLTDDEWYRRERERQRKR
jgi:hypothetical protein